MTLVLCRFEFCLYNSIRFFFRLFHLGRNRKRIDQELIKLANLIESDRFVFGANVEREERVLLTSFCSRSTNVNSLYLLSQHRQHLVTVDVVCLDGNCL